jgi:hypothetical protein
MEFGLARMAASPVAGKLNGVPVEFSPLTLGDWGTIEHYMRQQIISAAAESTANIPVERARMIMREAHREAAATSITSVDAKNGLFTSMSTMLRIVHLSMRKSKPGLTLEQVESMVGSDVEALTKMIQVIFGISFPGMDDSKNLNPGQAAEAR